jgi:hypothetical protein
MATSKRKKTESFMGTYYPSDGDFKDKKTRELRATPPPPLRAANGVANFIF